MSDNGNIQGKAPGTKRLIRLRSARDARRYIARIVRQMDAGEIPAEKGTKIAYVVSILIRSIETSEIETRLAEVEQAMGEKR